MSGTKVNGITPGQEADAIIYSFHSVKNLPISDAGMICFKEEKLDNLCRQYSWMGIDKNTFNRSHQSKGTYKWYYDVNHIGFKYHGNSITAAIGLVQLKYLDRDNSYRRKIAEWYDEQLSSISAIKIINHDNCESSRHLYQLITEGRDNLIIYMNEQGIYPGVHYRINTDYKIYDFAKHSCRFHFLLIMIIIFG